MIQNGSLAAAGLYAPLRRIAFPVANVPDFKREEAGKRDNVAITARAVMRKYYSGMLIGFVLGVAIGAALGNIVMGIGIGLALGTAIDLAGRGDKKG